MSSTDRFHITCTGCGTRVAVSKAHIGKKGRCPTCKTVFPITAPAAPEPIVADLVPTTADLQPISTYGLEPLSATGLQPLPQSWPAPQTAWQASSIPNPYGQSGPPSPVGAAAPSSYGQPASSFGQPAAGEDELRLAADANPYAAPTAPVSSFNFAPAQPLPDGTIRGSILGGIGMMVGAVVWFVGGLFFDILFYFPPVLFIIGLVAFVKGMIGLFNRG
jgi:hypothetical protein